MCFSLGGESSVLCTIRLEYKVELFSRLPMNGPFHLKIRFVGVVRALARWCALVVIVTVVVVVDYTHASS